MNDLIIKAVISQNRELRKEIRRLEGELDMCRAFLVAETEAFLQDNVSTDRDETSERLIL